MTLKRAVGGDSNLMHNRTLSVIAAMGELAVSVRQLAISVAIGRMNQALEDTDKVSSALLRVRSQLIEVRHEEN